MSAVFPTVMTLIEEYVYFSGRIASLLMIAAATGEMIGPIVWGVETTEAHPIRFVIINFVITSLHCVFTALMMWTGSLTTKSKSKLSNTTIELKSVNDFNPT